MVASGFSRTSETCMQRTLRLIVCLAALAVAGVASAQEDISSAKLRISWEDFKKQYDKNEVVVIDVRSAEAFELGHIPGSRSIPLDKVEQHVEELKAVTKPVVAYCA